MVSASHQAVQDAIVRFGEAHRGVNRVRLSGRPLHINHPTKSLSVLYNPDVHFVMSNRKTVVFEILESQVEAKTIADIIRSFLAPNVSQVYFFVFNEAKAGRVSDLCDIVLSKLADELGTKKRKLPLESKVIRITRTEVNNPHILDAVIKDAVKI